MGVGLQTFTDSNVTSIGSDRIFRISNEISVPNGGWLGSERSIFYENFPIKRFSLTLAANDAIAILSPNQHVGVLSVSRSSGSATVTFVCRKGYASPTGIKILVLTSTPIASSTPMVGFETYADLAGSPLLYSTKQWHPDVLGFINCRSSLPYSVLSGGELAVITNSTLLKQNDARVNISKGLDNLSVFREFWLFKTNQIGMSIVISNSLALQRDIPASDPFYINESNTANERALIISTQR